MSADTIALAKKINYDKLHFPVYLSKKLDGVPIKFTVSGDPTTMTTRSGKGSTISCGYIRDDLDSLITRHATNPISLTGEVTHKYDKAFKDVSGHVRRMTNNSDLILNLFDCNVHQCENSGFGSRMIVLSNLLDPQVRKSERINIIPQVRVSNARELEILTKFIPDGQEGWIIRNSNDPYEEGKRSWGYQKIVKTPTKDLLVTRFDEAISKDGVPLDMVGKLWLKYKGTFIGCGPGKLTHEERRDLWAWAKPFGGDISKAGWIAEVKYKIDPSYDALREASFVAWRFDKDTVNED
jgi:ATP-dependent DNA ligase